MNTDSGTIHHYVWLYDHYLPQRALGHISPIDALKRWYAEKTDLFVREPINHLGPDTTPFRGQAALALRAYATARHFYQIAGNSEFTERTIHN